MQMGPVRMVTRQDIGMVQQLVERCLQLYMTLEEVKEALYTVAYVDPRFTELVWRKLEEENKEFFEAYYMKLRLSQQITEFNNLLHQQVQLMHQNGELLSTYDPNGPQTVSLTQNSAYSSPGNIGLTVKQNMHEFIGSGLPTVFTDGGLSSNAGIRAAAKLPTHPIHVDAPQPAIIATQSSTIGLRKGSNDSMSSSRLDFESPVLNTSKEKGKAAAIMESWDTGLQGIAESIFAQRGVQHATCHEGMLQASQDQAAAGQFLQQLMAGSSAVHFGPESNGQNGHTEDIPFITAKTNSQPSPNAPPIMDSDTDPEDHDFGSDLNYWLLD